MLSILNTVSSFGGIFGNALLYSKNSQQANYITYSPMLVNFSSKPTFTPSLLIVQTCWGELEKFAVCPIILKRITPITHISACKCGKRQKIKNTVKRAVGLLGPQRPPLRSGN